MKSALQSVMPQSHPAVNRGRCSTEYYNNMIERAAKHNGDMGIHPEYDQQDATQAYTQCTNGDNTNHSPIPPYIWDPSANGPQRKDAGATMKHMRYKSNALPYDNAMQPSGQNIQTHHFLTGVITGNPDCMMHNRAIRGNHGHYLDDRGVYPREYLHPILESNTARTTISLIFVAKEASGKTSQAGGQVESDDTIVNLLDENPTQSQH